MSVHDAIAAVPTIASGDPVNKDLLRNYLVKRTIYPLGDAEDPEAFEALDTETGSIPIGLGWNGRIYWLDADDSTTAHDGTTCLVTDDGYRYKLEVVDFRINSVLDKDETDPPEDAELGDAYLVPAGASDDWGDHPDEVAIWTARGWAFIAPKKGSLLYVEDEETFYHYNAEGAWEAGIGQSALSDSSVRSNHLLGGRTNWIVVNQTTDAPPGSPTTGVAYIVGGSPTGAWTGHTGKIAQWSGAEWLIFSPVEGWTAYDQSENSTYLYSGSTWDFAGGAWGRILHYYTAGTGSSSSAGSTAWTTASAPTTTNARRTDDVTITVQAVAGKKIKFTYSAELTFSPLVGDTYVAVTLFRDSDATAKRWKIHAAMSVSPMTVNAVIIWETDDNASHEYKIAIVPNANISISSIQRREFMAEVSS